ncbi:MAG: gamma-glutamylcyclotransferase [Neptuniibacter sp.]|nr:gamma-glutamylcyclotransferase [Neptuniibacter sp.]
MSHPRLLDRLPNVELLGLGCLSQHQFRFHKRGRDGSAKADAHFTGNNNDSIYGVLYKLEESDLIVLDEIEDCGVGYERKRVEVRFSDQFLVASTYVALHIDRSLKPFHWYRQHVIHGAEQAGLPEQYVKHLKRLEYLQDRDHDRALRELAIYQ